MKRKSTSLVVKKVRIRDFMSREVKSCERDTPLSKVASLMIEGDCGSIPVLENKKPVGIVTDRDIVCRVLANQINPLEVKAKDCMTNTCHTILESSSLSEALKRMENNQVRRLLVVSETGDCVGIVSQADVVMKATSRQIHEMMKEISKPVAKKKMAA